MHIWLLSSHVRQEWCYNMQRKETIFYQAADDDEKIPIAQILNVVFI